jgi:hypothetical protein
MHALLEDVLLASKQKLRIFEDTICERNNGAWLPYNQGGSGRKRKRYKYSPSTQRHIQDPISNQTRHNTPQHSCPVSCPLHHSTQPIALPSIPVSSSFISSSSTHHTQYSLPLFFLLSIKMATYLITGALRGLGLGLARGLLAQPSTSVSLVIVTARQRNDAWDELEKEFGGRVAFVRMELDEEGIGRGVEEVEKVLGDRGLEGLDVLANNAGVQPVTPGGTEKM